MLPIFQIVICEIRPSRKLPVPESPQRESVSRGRQKFAFTLVELLVVISSILAMTALIVPVFTGIKSGTDLTKATYDIKGTLDQARAYAMANNTYVWVGFAETDATQDASVTPQTAGNGRIVVAVVASKDGTRGYDATSTSLGTPPWSDTIGATLVAICKLQHFENLHLASSFSMLPTMFRQTVTDNHYVLGSAACKAVTCFDWPLGKAVGTGRYSFIKVINFDPQGIARIQQNNNNDDIASYMEIGLIPIHGNSVPSTTPSNVAAIQVSGLTGATRIYRP